MITTYKNNELRLEVLPEPTDASWLNVIDPNPEEIKLLVDMGVPQDYITYPLDLDERPRTERENGDLLIVLRIPYFQGETSDVPYITIPMGIILTKDYIVTVCKYENEILGGFSSGRIRDLSTSKRNRFILRLLLATATQYLAYLRRITKVIDQLEDKLQASTRNKEVLELLKYEKSLTYFTTALRSNELMMERLERSLLFKMYPDDEDLLEDVLTENQQAIEMVNIAGNILSQMMDAFASIISNNLNMVMKVLASITIVLALPTMIASFYGMNVELPMQHSAYAFLLVMAISFGISLAVVFVFVKRDWF
jgi:magnesium transporter